ncbi:MAG: hypothetical protein ACO1OC_11815 [Tuberibacillus sp.]
MAETPLSVFVSLWYLTFKFSANERGFLTFVHGYRATERGFLVCERGFRSPSADTDH